MKKYQIANKWRFGIAIVLWVLAAVILAMGIYRSFFLTTLALPANTCEELFGCTPKEFFDLDLDLYDETRDFRTHAYVDKQGKLVLRLSQNQIDVWLLSLKQDIIDIERQHETIDVSDDYYTITIYGYEETVDKDSKISMALTHTTAVIRFLTDQPPTYKVILLDGATGRVIWSQSMDSDGNRECGYESGYDFGEIYEESK
ncbi:MAG: hypothetical protein E7605_01345 [Ruminococcaceae bacterium]|nr:hypothetical protein [Oscillospiraceae bacterium]